MHARATETPIQNGIGAACCFLWAGILFTKARAATAARSDIVFHSPQPGHWMSATAAYWCSGILFLAGIYLLFTLRRRRDRRPEPTRLPKVI